MFDRHGVHRRLRWFAPAGAFMAVVAIVGLYHLLTEHLTQAIPYLSLLVCLLFAGLVLHDGAISIEERLRWWERGLFWLSWALLVGMAGWASFSLASKFFFEEAAI